MNKTILRYDASLLKKSYCPKQFKLIGIDGYSSPVLYNDTNYGTSLHRFVAVMYFTGGNFELALREALKQFKKTTNVRNKKEHLNEKHFVKTCLDYWEQSIAPDDFELVINPNAVCWLCGGSGFVGSVETVCTECKGEGHRAQPLVEINFEIPILETDTHIVLLCGTIDRFGKFKNGCYAVRDYKTTSSWDIAKYMRQYALSPQLRVYVWAIKKMAALNPDSQLAEICKSPIGACIDGVFLKSQKETVFERSEVFIYKQPELDYFEELLLMKAKQLVRLHTGEDAPIPLGKVEGTCSSMFQCQFYDVCAAPSDIAAKHILTNEFRQKSYDPLSFNED